MTTADDLRAAKALIDTPEKWGKGLGSFWRPDNTPACAHEACRRVVRGRSVGRDTQSGMRDALFRVLPLGWESTPEFNDARTTTHADIMALFDRAIAAAETSSDV